MPARTDIEEPDHTTIAQAAAWHAELADEHWDDAQRPALDAWLDADPAHRLAFERMAALADRVSGTGPIERSALRRAKSKRAARVGVLSGSLTGCLALLGWAAMHDPAIRAHIAGERSAIGELRSANLASGDRILLDTDSAADLDDADRSVSLWRGGLMATVRHGAPRPFVVRTPLGTAKALGTRFSVRLENGGAVVTVIESRVEACASSGRRNCLTLQPGQAARLDASGAQALPNVDPLVAGAWSEGMLFADDLPLAQVLNQLNYYRRVPIRYRPDDIGGLRVTGTFPLIDADRALASIALALPVMVEHTAGGPEVRHR
jgi:transmembrane sensor